MHARHLIFAVVSLVTFGVGSAHGQFTPPHDGSNGIDCLDCHTIHGDPQFDYHTVQGNINLCKSCHNDVGLGDVNTHSPGGADMACTSCHNPHSQEQELAYGSTFSKLIRTTIATPNSGDWGVVLMSPTGHNSFADGDAVYDGVCEACHTATDHHRNNPSGDHAHNVGLDCRSCHPHSDGFQPTGGACTGCHNQIQPPQGGYRRQIVENNGDGLGDFIRYSHHVNDRSGWESVTDGDCVVCHDQSGHWSHPDPEVLLLDPDGGSSYTFDGTPGSITDFCRHCHDPNGRGGDLAPFSSGFAPPDIEQWWGQSPAHASTPVGVGCWSCHQNGHGSDSPSLTAALEETGCLSCHDGQVAGTDIAADFNKTYRHPIADQSLVHLRGEDPLNMPRHAECEDCHEPHAADGSIPGNPPLASGLLRGVSGIDTDGNVVSPVTNGFELCYKCHADTSPASPALSRQWIQANVRLEFDPAQPSYHPIEAAGQNPDVPSLIGGWTTGSVMTCWDCHAGANKGPHGSDDPWILKLPYETGDNVSEGPGVYALCYSCHDRNSILGDNSFGEHQKHIQGEKTSCATCHDAHGSAVHTENPSGHHLINFMTGRVTRNNKNELFFQDDGRYRGACSLKCHNKDHDLKNY